MRLCSLHLALPTCGTMALRSRSHTDLPVRKAQGDHHNPTDRHQSPARLQYAGELAEGGSTVRNKYSRAATPIAHESA